MTTNWKQLRADRMAAPEAQAAYDAARIAYAFGRCVRARREELGLTQAGLALATRTSQSAIARIEAGGTEPTLRTINALSRALGSAWVISEGSVTSQAEHRKTRGRRSITTP